MIDGCHVPPTSFGDHLGSFTQITQNQHQFYSVSSVLSPGLISRPHDLLTILVDENLGPDPLNDCPARHQRRQYQTQCVLSTART